MLELLNPNLGKIVGIIAILILIVVFLIIVAKNLFPGGLP